MPSIPQNCFYCKNPWPGKGPMCDRCAGIILQPPITPTLCSFCNGAHDTADCLKAALANLAQNAYNYQLNMAARKRKPYTFTRTGRMHYDPAPLKYCSACKSNYLIESKAGAVCTSCHAVVHNPCRNCTSANTHGVTGDSTQFIECGDCLFIE